MTRKEIERMIRDHMARAILRGRENKTATLLADTLEVLQDVVEESEDAWVHEIIEKIFQELRK